MLKTLLLNSTYQTIGFIPFRKLIKLIVKDKVEIISRWQGEKVRLIDGHFEYPSIVRLKYYANVKFLNRIRFNRKGIFRRDMYQCLYCGISVTNDSATLDHVLPTSKGGKSSWFNCITSCISCNMKKGNRTPEEAGMVMIRQPITPTNPLVNEYILTKPKHDDWSTFFPQVEKSIYKSHI